MTSLLSTKMPDLGQRLVDHGLWLCLFCAGLVKAIILGTNSITFDSDEAIVALMARHILRGERPLFFYGQSYMGALDAYLMAPFLLIFGENVLAARLSQVVLYLAVIVTTYMLAFRLTSDRVRALVAGLLVAIPPVTVSLYTTSTLGDYVEILVLNNLLFLLGWKILSQENSHPGLWMSAGIVAGLGWWSMALIVISIVPLLAVGVRKFKWRIVRSLPWAVVGFGVGASPWLIATLSRGSAATVNDLVGAWVVGNPGEDPIAQFGYRLVSLIVFNLTALIGMRPSWSVEWIALPVGVIVAAVYVVVVGWSVRSVQIARHDNNKPFALSLLMAGGLLLLLFVASPFGTDPTGRYLIALYPLLAILFSDRFSVAISRGMVNITPRWSKVIGWSALAICLTYNAWGNMRSIIRNPPGMTKQFDPITQIPHDYDDNLIAFLDSIDIHEGYSNVWIAYRFAFLTHERIVLSPRLPYKADLSYTYGDDRYAPYSAQVKEADQVVYITSNHSELDELIRRRFGIAGIGFKVIKIGPYTVFYDLSQRISPEELGPFGAVTGKAIHDGE